MDRLQRGVVRQFIGGNSRCGWSDWRVRWNGPAGDAVVSPTLDVSESAFAEFSFSTPSAPPPTYTFKLTGHAELLPSRPSPTESMAAELSMLKFAVAHGFVSN